MSYVVTIPSERDFTLNDAIVYVADTAREKNWPHALFTIDGMKLYFTKDKIEAAQNDQNILRYSILSGCIDKLALCLPNASPIDKAYPFSNPSLDAFFSQRYNDIENKLENQLRTIHAAYLDHIIATLAAIGQSDEALAEECVNIIDYGVLNNRSNSREFLTEPRRAAILQAFSACGKLTENARKCIKDAGKYADSWEIAAMQLAEQAARNKGTLVIPPPGYN